MIGVTAAALRHHALARTFFPPVDLQAAIARLGFVQIDPLRAPARAQDLILRHRVAGYRAGDLDRQYGSLPLAEEFVHVQGVVPAATRRFLHPRVVERSWHVEREHPQLATAMLAHIGRHGATHPRDLARAFGRAAVVNGWGGRSSATTRMLEVLHYRGHLHVVRREDGIKVYALADPVVRPLGARMRFLRLLDLLLRLYAPLPVASLRELGRMAADESFAAPAREALLASFLRGDAVARAHLDGLEYVWPADDPASGPVEDVVRLVAPFDPLVWDRRRFAHLHGWDYRFEAYTPAAKRRFGYYALPLVWRDKVVGWANVRREGAGVEVATGFAGRAPAGRAYVRAFDAEVARLTAFLVAPVPADRP